MFNRRYVTAAERVQELFADDIRKSIDIAHLEQMLVAEGLPFRTARAEMYFLATAALDAAICDILHLDL